jgi:DNA-binding transcriptional MerR regulator
VHRRFDDGDLDWLVVLRCLRDTGMPIAQMRRYAELARCGEATVAERLRLLTEHEKIDWYRGQMGVSTPA